MKVAVALSPPYPQADLVLVPGLNLTTGMDEMQRRFGTLTSLEQDLLILAATVFAADVGVLRGSREEFVRDIELSIPVVNWRILQAHLEDLRDILYFLSEDNWSITLTPRPGDAEGTLVWSEQPGTTLLFSGGLDSLAAAYQYLSHAEPLTLASHYTASPATQGAQRRLYDALSSAFALTPDWVRVHITARAHPQVGFPRDDARENTQRTRSFMFMVIAGVVARRVGRRRLVCLAENGQMAIHLPLSAARIGAFSTHTAHPEFIALMKDWLCRVLGVDITVENPFVYSTKAECVATIVAKAQDLVPLSVSCWRGARQAESHCGQCVPCLIRRIALEHHGLRLNEYARDLFSENIGELGTDDIGRRNITELMEFAVQFRDLPPAQLEINFPDLISGFFDRTQGLDMYRRFAREATGVLSGYSGIAPLL